MADHPGNAAAVVWLGDPDSLDPAVVGPKAAHLAALAAAHDVPAGFCVTAAAFRDAAVGARGDGGDRSYDATYDALRAAVADAYERLVADDPTGGYVAVRSSAVDEDGAVASFAGQHDTVLNVRGADAVLAALEASWASLRSEAALAYRRQHALEAHDLALAVLVQRMVWADAAGVAFSVDPISGAVGTVVVTASWGLGESVVGGTVTADTWRLDKADLRVLEASVGEKERMVIPSEDGTRDVAVPGFLRARPALDDEQLRAVADVTRSLERERGWPVDVEFAWRDGRLALLQCRPVTRMGTRA
jgi:phosphoenolpyruvate synthase/pyruvate phosphate dikinase